MFEAQTGSLDCAFEEPLKTDLETDMMRAGVSEVPGPMYTPSVAEGVERRRYGVKALAKTIDKALRERDNPFNVLIGVFTKLFLKRYLPQIREFGAGFYEDYRQHFNETREKKNFVPKKLTQFCAVTQEALLAIQGFIKLLLYCLSIIYSPIVGTVDMTILRDLINNSLIDIIIRDDMYSVIFMFLRLDHQAEEEMIVRKIKQLESIQPQFLGINEFLCLNHTSPILEIVRQARRTVPDILPEGQPEPPHVEPVQDTEERNEASEEKGTGLYEENKCNINSSFIEDADGLPSDEVLVKRMQSPPFKLAITKLKGVARLGTPMEKLQCLATLNASICSCIDSFWKGVPVKREKLSIDADQYLSVLIYILVKANVPNLFTHITLTNELASFGSSSSYNSYCLTTMQACFYHLLNVDTSTLIKRKSLRRPEFDPNRKLSIDVAQTLIPPAQLPVAEQSASPRGGRRNSH
jgi:hypothetical protein